MRPHDNEQRLPGLIYKCIPLEDKFTLEDYNIEEMSNIHVIDDIDIGTESDKSKIMQIFVNILGKDRDKIYTITLDVEGNKDTIKSVKAQVRDLVGIAMKHQQIIFAGKHLSDGEQLLSECKVGHQCLLHVIELRPIKVR